MASQQYDADKVNVYNGHEDDILGRFSLKSFLLGALVTLNAVLIALVIILFVRISHLEQRLEEKIEDTKTEVIQILKNYR